MNSLFQFDLFYPYAIPPFLTSLICFFLATLTFQAGKSKRENQLFTIICLLQALLNLEITLFSILTSAEIALKICRIDWAVFVFIIPVILHFVLEVAGFPYQKKLIWGLYLFSIVFVPITQTKYHYFGMHKYFFGFYPQGGPAFQVFGGVALIVSIYSAFIIWKAIKCSTDPKQRLKAKFVFYGLLVNVALMLGDILPVFGVPIYPPGNFGFIPMGLMGYGLLQHQILETTKKGVTKGFIPRLLTLFVWTPIVLSIGLWLFERDHLFYSNILERIFPYAVPSIISLLVCFIMATICFMQRTQKETTILFGLISTLWGFLNLDITLNMLLSDQSLGLYLNRIDHLFLVYQVGLSAHFIYSVIGRRQRWTFVYPLYAMALILMPFTQTHWYLQGNTEFFWGFYAQKNFLFDVFSFVSSITVIWGVILLFREGRAEKNIDFKKKYYYVLIGIVSTAGLNLFSLPPLYGIEFYPFGNFTFIPILIMGYGIFHHNIIHLTIYSKKRILGRIVQLIVISGFIILIPISYWAVGDLSLGYIFSRIIPYGIPPLITALTSGFFAVLSLKVGQNQKEALLFSLFCMIGVFLNTDILLNCIVVKEAIGLQLNRWDHMFLVFSTALGLHITYMILGRKNRWGLVYFSYGLSLVFSSLTQTDLYISGMYTYYWGFFAKSGPILNAVGVYWISSTIYMIYLLIRGYRQTENIFQGQRMLFVAIGFGLSIALSVCNFLPISGYEIYPAGNFAFITSILLGLGMFRHNLKEVVKIAKTTLFWLGLFAALLGAAVVFKSVYPTDYSLTIYLAVLVAIIVAYQFVYSLWNMVLSLFMGVEKERFNEVLISLADDLSRGHSIDTVYRAVINCIFKELYSRNCTMLFPPYPEKDSETSLQISECNFIGWETFNPQKGLYSTSEQIPEGGNAIDLMADHPLLPMFAEHQELTGREKTEEWMMQQNIALDPEDRIFQAELILPIFFEQKLNALILFGNKIDGTIYSNDEKEFVNRMGMLLGPHIENAILLQTFEKKVEERTHELRAALSETRLKGQEIAHLSQVSQIINSTLDLNIILSSFEKALKEIFAFNQIIIFIANHEKNSLSLSKYIGVKSDEIKELEHYNFDLKPGISLTCETVLKNRPIYLPDITSEMMQTATPLDQTVMKINPMRAMLFCPVLIQQEVIGTIVFSNTYHPFHLTTADINRIQRYVTHIATAINNAQMAEETRQALLAAKAKEQEIAHINQVVQTVNSTLDLDQVLAAVVDALKIFFQFNQVSIQMRDEEKNTLVIIKCFEDGISSETIKKLLHLEIPIRKNHSIFADAVLKNKPIYFPQITPNLLKYNKLFDNKIHELIQGKAYLVYPLEVQNKIVGTISFGDTKNYFSLTKDDILKIRRYVTQIATAINNARMAEEIQQALLATKAKEKEIAHINQVIQTVNSTLDLDQTFTAVFNALKNFFQFNQVSLQMVDEEQNNLVALKFMGDGFSPEMIQQLLYLETSIKEDYSIFADAILRNKPIYIPQMTPDVLKIIRPFDNKIHQLIKGKAYLICPLEVQGKVVGIISYGNTLDFLNLNKDDIIKIQRYVSHIAAAINNARLAEEIQRALQETKAKEREIAHINQIMQVVNSTLNLDEVIAAITDVLQDIFLFDQVGILLIDEKQNCLRNPKFYGDGLDYEKITKLERTVIPIKKNFSIFVDNILAGHPVYLPQVTPDMRSLMYPFDQEVHDIILGKAYLFCPMEIQKKIVGTINFGNSKDYFNLSRKDIEKIQRYVSQITTAIHNAQLADELKLVNENLKFEISERQKASEALRQSEEKYRNILDNMEDLYSELDLAGNFVFFNKAHAVALDLEPDELINKNYTEFIDEPTAIRVFTEFHEVFLTDKPKLIGWEATSKGKRAYVEAMVSLQKNSEGRPIGFRYSARDITLKRTAEMELKKAKEAAEAATKFKSEFLANMSHEIRTPMNAILGMADLLSETCLTSEQKAFAQTINSSGELLLSIINDILDFSKIEAGQMALEETAFDLMELVETACKMLAVKAHEKGLELNCRMALDVHPFRMGDPTRLRQIFINLLNNAIKFTHHGEVILEVVNSDDPELLQFCVRDTGIGIPKKKQQIIFDSFSQVDSSITRRYGGTGLGLAICKRLVDLMGGHIWIESEEGRGTRFFFTARISQTAPIPISGNLSPTELEGMQILVIDDNETNRLICKELLSSWCATVTESESGAQAIQLIAGADRQGKPYHLILLDLRMPEMDGFQVAEQINGLSLTHLPRMVMLTSSNAVEEKTRARDLNITAYIVKPFRRTELLEGILIALGKKETIAEQIQPVGKLAEIMLPPLRILLAEDIEPNRNLLKLYLKDFPITIDIAENGRIAVEKFIGNTYDVVLMDIEMPEMDGLSATQAIRKWEQEKGKPRTPVIALTAHAFSEHREKCFEAGCTGYLTKPIKKNVLIEKLLEFAGSDETNPDKNQTCPEPPPEILDEGKLSHHDCIVCIDADLKELIPDFMAQTRDDFDGMIKALADQDSETLRRIGHSLKGSARMYEFMYLGELGMAIEEAAKKNDLAAIEKALEKLKEYLALIKIEYK